MRRTPTRSTIAPDPGSPEGAASSRTEVWVCTPPILDRPRPHLEPRTLELVTVTALTGLFRVTSSRRGRCRRGSGRRGAVRRPWVANLERMSRGRDAAIDWRASRAWRSGATSASSSVEPVGAATAAASSRWPRRARARAWYLAEPRCRARSSSSSARAGSSRLATSIRRSSARQRKGSHTRINGSASATSAPAAPSSPTSSRHSAAARRACSSCSVCSDPSATSRDCSIASRARSSARAHVAQLPPHPRQRGRRPGPVELHVVAVEQPPLALQHPQRAHQVAQVGPGQAGEEQRPQQGPERPRLLARGHGPGQHVPGLGEAVAVLQQRPQARQGRRHRRRLRLPVDQRLLVGGRRPRHVARPVPDPSHQHQRRRLGLGRGRRRLRQRRRLHREVGRPVDVAPVVGGPPEPLQGHGLQRRCRPGPGPAPAPAGGRRGRRRSRPAPPGSAPVASTPGPRPRRRPPPRPRPGPARTAAPRRGWRSGGGRRRPPPSTPSRPAASPPPPPGGPPPARDGRPPAPRSAGGGWPAPRAASSRTGPTGSRCWRRPGRRPWSSTAPPPTPAGPDGRPPRGRRPAPPPPGRGRTTPPPPPPPGGTPPRRRPPAAPAPSPRPAATGSPPGRRPPGRSRPPDGTPPPRTTRRRPSARTPARPARARPWPPPVAPPPPAAAGPGGSPGPGARASPSPPGPPPAAASPPPAAARGPAARP